MSQINISSIPKKMTASELIKSPIIIDQQSIIYKLRNMRYAQTEVFEDSINNYVLLSSKMQPISKYQQQQDHKGDISKPAAINEDADAYPIDHGVPEQQRIPENTTINNEMRLMELQGKQLALSSTIRQLENVIKDLTEETNQKTLLFTEQLRNNLNLKDSTNSNLLNTRFALPRTVIQYSFLQSKGRQLLAWLEKEDNGLIFLRFFNLTTQKTIPQSIPGNFSHFSAFEDTVLLAEEGKEIEVWRMNSINRNEGVIDSLQGSNESNKTRKVSLDINNNNSKSSRKVSGEDSKLKRKMSSDINDKLDDVQFTRLMTANAHNDGVTASQLLSRNIFVTCSRKGILKIWQALPQRLLSVHRFDSYATAFALLPHSIQILAPINSFLVAAGFANGIVRIVQFRQEMVNNYGNVDNNIQTNTSQESQQPQQQIDDFENMNICEIKFEISLKNYYYYHKSPSETNVSANTSNISPPPPPSIIPPLPSAMEIINSLQTAHCRAEGDWCNQVIIAAGVSTHPDNIYLISCLRKKAYNLQESGEHLYRNSSASRQFGLTGESLFAGSFNGQVFTWDISQLSMVNLLTPVVKRINLAITYATVSVFYVQYDAVTDQLLSADQQGNVLVWNGYQASIVRK